MSDVLFINACTGPASRTRRLVDEVLKRLSGSYSELDLQNIPIAPLNAGTLSRRDRLLSAEAYQDEMFHYARMLARPKEIVIAAPYWDLSFPSSLKVFLETVNVPGITFRYNEQGVPVGLCRAGRLIYVTTAGGQILSDAFGYGYVKALATQFWGIKETICFRAEGLDIIGADVETILCNARNQVVQYFSKTHHGGED